MRLAAPRLLPLIASIAALAAAGPAAAAGPSFGQLDHPFGSLGSGDGQYQGPDFFVNDASNSKLYVGDEFQADNGSGLDFFFRLVPFTKDGTAESTFPTPAVSGSTDCCQWAPNWDGAAVDPGSHTMYVARTGTNGAPDSVDRFDLSAGSKLANFAPSQFGAAATKLSNPSAVAVSPVTDATTKANAGDVYVAGIPGGTNNFVVRRFNAAGVKQNDIAPAAGTFNVPADANAIPAIAVDPRDGSLWVLDYDANWDPNDNETFFFTVSHFKADGAAMGAPINGLVLDPGAEGAGTLTVGPDGNVWLAGAGVIYEYQPDGTKLQQLGSPAAAPDADNCEFNHNHNPIWLSVIGDGTVYALDTDTKAILKFGAGGTRCGGGNKAPSVSAITPAAGSNGLKNVAQTYSVTATDSDGSIASYEWQVDGAADGTGSSSLTHTFTSAGTHHLSVTVTDDQGASTTKLLDVTIHSRPPIAALGASATAIQTGGDVSFDASASSDPDGTIAKYEWDFGDASGAYAQGPAAQTHNYGRAGTFTARVRVTDVDGDSAVKTVAITVTDPPAPPPGNNPPGGPIGPQGPTTPADTTPPAITVTGGTLKAVKNAVSVTVSCPGSEKTCSGTVTLVTAKAVAAAKTKKKIQTLGKATFTINGGKKATVKITLSSVGRKLLKKSKKLKIVLKVSAKDAAGNARTVASTGTLAAARKR